MSISDDEPMYGKWPFPQVSQEAKAKLKELGKRKLIFKYDGKGWWFCDEVPDLKVELGDFPDDPMYFFWDGDVCLGYGDVFPGAWINKVEEEEGGCGLVGIGLVAVVFIIIWFVYDFN